MRAKSISTTPVIALFIIISVTGVFLLLHVGSSSMKSIHEWLGFAFIVFGVLHAGANWNLMKRYLGGIKGAVIALMIISTLGYSALRPTSGHDRPDKSIFTQVMQAPLTTIALLYGKEANSLAEQLHAKGYTVTSVDKTLEEIASENNTQALEIMEIIAVNKNH